MSFMGRVGLVLAAIAVANILTFNAAPSYADLIPSAPQSAPVAPAADADRAAVQAHLTGLGLSAADVAARLEALDAQDVAVLADNPRQVQMAGTAPIVAVVFGILAAVALVVLIDSTSQAEEPEPISEPK